MQSILTVSKPRRARLEAGKTLLQLQLETGVNASKLSAAERGLLRLTGAEQRVIARALGADHVQLYATSAEPRGDA